MNERTEALEDIDTWAAETGTDDLDRPLEWERIGHLDLAEGPSRKAGSDEFADLARMYDTRLLLERTIHAMNKTWMFDRKRRISSYRLARALAWYSRRLNDLIDSLEKVIPEDARPNDPMEEFDRELKGRPRDGGGNGWRDRYLPGNGVAEVVGIDLETTGLDPLRDYVIDAGWERMDMTGGDHSGQERDIYSQDGYAADGAWDQERESYGVPPMRVVLGNPAEDVSGISTMDLDGLKPLDEDAEAQERLLEVLTSAPFVAHNATFEHKHFMSNVAGYAEAYRDGKVTIIDTMVMSMRWNRNGGNNRLETYAKQFGGLADDGSERHLGLEDTHIMLVAMRNHLHELHEEDMGPWGPDGRNGTGGKTCR